MSAKGKQLDGSVSAHAAYGEEVRAWREKKGWSQYALAHRARVSESMIGKIEAAQRYSDLGLAEKLDELLQAGGTLVRGWRRADRERRRWELERALAQAARQDEYAEGHERTKSPSPDGSEEADMKRRDALGLGAWLGIGAVGDVLAGPAGRAKSFLRWAETSDLGPMTLSSFESELWVLAERATVMPSAEQLAIAERQFTEIAVLLHRGHLHTAEKKELEVLAGKYAYVKGRLWGFRLGDYSAATTNLLIAQHYGMRHSEHTLISSAAATESAMAFRHGDYPKSLEVAQKGRKYTTVHTAARLSATEARALGALGKRTEMRHTFARAHRELRDDPSREAGATPPFFPETLVSFEATGTVMARDDSGEQLARETISRYQSLEGSRADKQNLSLVELDLGRGIVQRPQPDPDEAASMCLRAINVDEPERSDLVRRTAHEVLQLLSPWAERDSVQAFADALRCYRPVAVGS